MQATVLRTREKLMGQSVHSCSVTCHRCNDIKKKTNSWHFLPQTWLKEIKFRGDCQRQEPLVNNLENVVLIPCTISLTHL